MNNTMDWLELISENYDDMNWLADNEAEIYGVIAQLLRERNMRSMQKAIDILLLVLPDYVNSAEIKRWYKLCKRAYKLSQKRLTADPATEKFRQIYVFTPQPAPTIGPRRPRSARINTRELYEMYVNLFMTRFYTRPERMTAQAIDSLLRLTGQINIPYYYHKIYQTLALIYNYFGEFDRALDRLRMCHAYWSEQNNILEMALTAYATAEAYLGKNNSGSALRWLESAASLFDQIDLPEQQAIMAAELAALNRAA